MFGLGLPELLLIALFVLLFFGAKRLPSIGTGLGKTVKEVRAIKKELSQDKKPEGKAEPAQEPVRDKNSLEGQLADKVIEKVPGIGQVKKLKDKAEKIKKIVR